MQGKNMPLKGFFITGTDTGVGKTAVGAALLYLIRERGIVAAPVKPVQTGAGPGERGDLDVYLETSNLEPGPGELALMNPYKFRLPASAHLAAETEGAAPVSPEHIGQCCRKLNEKYEALLVEGVGGLLVPLTRSLTSLELMRILGLPLVVVARAGLGTINHCLLTINTALNAGLNVAAVVLNRVPELHRESTSKQVIADNRDIIEELTGVEVWQALPHVPGAGENVESTRELASHLEAAGAGRLRMIVDSGESSS
ncbi:MAG: dethiobiotin synthase [Gemmatimonadota bacterium]|nr:dethiobiotin synthase [Gemmatimonadota bacterium]